MSPDLINEILEIINNNEHIVLDKTELETIQASYEYNEMMKMPAIDISYNDIKWIYYEYQGEDVINKIVNNCKKIQLPIFDYICNIIINEKYEKRDKVVLIIAHMEACIFQCLETDKGKKPIVKDIRDIVSKENDNKVTNSNYARIFLMGIVKVLYANTNNFKNPIDNRIPYRNNILHKGIVSYSDDNIEDLYYILVCFFAKLTECELQFVQERKIKEIDAKRKSMD